MTLNTERKQTRGTTAWPDGHHLLLGISAQDLHASHAPWSWHYPAMRLPVVVATSF